MTTCPMSPLLLISGWARKSQAAGPQAVFSLPSAWVLALWKGSRVVEGT